MSFIIQDWAGNVCFEGIRFVHFEDAWGFICEKVDDPEAHCDYFVVQV